MRSHSSVRVFNVLVALVLLASASAPMAARTEPIVNLHPKAELSGLPADGSILARVYFDSVEEKNALASKLDVWEVNHVERYLLVMLGPGELEAIQAAGYRAEIDTEKTAMLAAPAPLIPGQTEGIPGYPCYRTVEETFDTLYTLETTYPTLAQVIDIGDSWDKATAGGAAGYDMLVLKLTNQDIPGPKPRFFLMAEIHARELTTAEAATRFAEYLLQNYGTNPEITFFLDYYEVHIVPMTNPDGRKYAEQGIWWRKNTDGDDGCSDPNNRGVDLNRNHSFKWGCCGGSSPYPCDEVYRGPSAASEPEIIAIQDYVLSLFPDQRGPGDTDPAPLDATGILISLHSYGGANMWPWGWSPGPAPNSAQLQALGVKFSTYNFYDPHQDYYLYVTDGTTDDWSYGTLGIASFIWEIGDQFFEGCSAFENTIWPDNRDALYYAVKVPDTPYMTVYGPDTSNMAVDPIEAPQGAPVQLTASVNDQQNGSQVVQGAEYFVLPLHGPAAPGDPGTGTAMQPADGSWNSTNENVVATLDTNSLEPGDYVIAARGKDASNNWGPFSAAFLTITGPIAPTAEFSSNSPFELGSPAVFSNETTGPGNITYQWDFGDGVGTSTEVSPTYTYTDLGVYTVTLTAENQGGTDSISHTVEVMQGCTALTGLDLTYTPTVILAGDVVTFTADLAPNEFSSPYSYTIDYGDGMTATAASGADPLSLSHTYAASGTFTATISAWNCAEGAVVTDTVVVIVEEPPACVPLESVGLTLVTTDTLYLGDVARLTAMFSPSLATTPFEYTIGFADGITPTEGTTSENPILITYTYSSAGSFTVTMTAWNCEAGAVVTDTLVITIVSPGNPYQVNLPVVIKAPVAPAPRRIAR